jgi:hypothetical protein
LARISVQPVVAVATVLGVLAVLTVIIASWGKMKQKAMGEMLVVGVFAVGIIVLSLYTETVFDHYLAVLFPLIYLTIGIAVVKLWRLKLLRPLLLLFLAVTVWRSVLGLPKLYIYSNEAMTKTVVQAIEARLQPGDTYNILLLADSKDLQGLNYRYFLTTWTTPPADENYVQPFRKLFVIDEQHRRDPIDTSQYIIIVWPNHTIVDDFTLPGGPRVVELIR